MARIRTIKPEFWADEKLAPLPDRDRLVFLGLISMADDLGRLLDNIKVIDAFVFPESMGTARESLATLSRIGRIRRGRTSSGQRVIQIVNWIQHQKVDHPNVGAALPEIVEDTVDTDIREAVANDSRDVRDPLAPLSVPVPVPTTSTISAPKGAIDPRWRERVIDLAKAVPLGIEAPRLLRVLKRLVERDGSEKVLAHWAEFLSSGRNFTDDGKFVNESRPIKCLTPERFTNSYDDWAPSTIRRPAA